MTTEKLKRQKSPGIDQIPSELMTAGGRMTHSEIHELMNSIWNKEEMSEEWQEAIIVPICKMGDKPDCSNYISISFLSTTYIILSNILLSRKLLGIISVDFNKTHQLLTYIPHSSHNLTKNWNTMKQCISYL
jgi:hypothetical protein